VKKSFGWVKSTGNIEALQQVTHPTSPGQSQKGAGATEPQPLPSDVTVEQQTPASAGPARVYQQGRLIPADPITIATIKTNGKLAQAKNDLPFACSHVMKKRKELGLDGRSNMGIIANTILLPRNTFSLAPGTPDPSECKQHTNQQVSYNLDALNVVGKSDSLGALNLIGQKEITSLDLTSFRNIEIIQLDGCTKLKHINLGNAKVLNYIDGLKDLSDATFYCKNFTPDDARLMEAFSEAKPGSIICTEWSVVEAVDGEKVDKTLTPQSGYRKTKGGSWERVEWNQGQQPAGQQAKQLPPDKPMATD
jgi:hypothetical protein